MDFNKNKKGRFTHEGLSTYILAVLNVKGIIQGKMLILLFVQITRKNINIDLENQLLIQ
jgi:hypothetical protein